MYEVGDWEAEGVCGNRVEEVGCEEAGEDGVVECWVEDKYTIFPFLYSSYGKNLYLLLEMHKKNLKAEFPIAACFKIWEQFW